MKLNFGLVYETHNMVSRFRPMCDLRSSVCNYNIAKVLGINV